MTLAASFRETFSLKPHAGEARTSSALDEFAGLALIVSATAYLHPSRTVYKYISMHSCSACKIVEINRVYIIGRRPIQIMKIVIPDDVSPLRPVSSNVNRTDICRFLSQVIKFIVFDDMFVTGHRDP